MNGQKLSTPTSEIEKFINCFEQLLKIHPHDVIAKYFLSSVFYKINELNKAKKLLSEIISSPFDAGIIDIACHLYKSINKRYHLPSNIPSELETFIKAASREPLTKWHQTQIVILLQAIQSLFPFNSNISKFAHTTCAKLLLSISEFSKAIALLHNYTKRLPVKDPWAHIFYDIIIEATEKIIETRSEQAKKNIRSSSKTEHYVLLAQLNTDIQNLFSLYEKRLIMKDAEKFIRNTLPKFGNLIDEKKYLNYIFLFLESVSAIFVNTLLDYESQKYQASLYIKINQTEYAVKIYERLLNTFNNCDNSDILLFLANHYLNIGIIDRSYHYFNMILENYPDSLHAEITNEWLLRLAKLYKNNEEFMKSNQLLKKIKHQHEWKTLTAKAWLMMAQNYQKLYFIELNPEFKTLSKKYFQKLIASDSRYKDIARYELQNFEKHKWLYYFSGKRKKIFLNLLIILITLCFLFFLAGLPYIVRQGLFIIIIGAVIALSIAILAIKIPDFLQKFW